MFMSGSGSGVIYKRPFFPASPDEDGSLRPSVNVPMSLASASGPRLRLLAAGCLLRASSAIGVALRVPTAPVVKS